MWDNYMIESYASRASLLVRYASQQAAQHYLSPTATDAPYQGMGVKGGSIAAGNACGGKAAKLPAPPTATQR